MSKELEALKRLFDSNTENSHEDYDLLYKAILELKAIKEAKPSEALEWLNKFKGIEIYFASKVNY